MRTIRIAVTLAEHLAEVAAAAGCLAELAAEVDRLRAGGGEPKRPRQPRSGKVYLIQTGYDGPIKIGWSRDPQSRLYDLQAATPEPLRLVGWVPGTKDDERTLHERFFADRISGEWFRPSPELVALGEAWEHERATAVARMLEP